MLSYTARRIATGLVTLFGITIVSFGIIQLAPGDPAQLQTSQIADATVSQRVYEQLRELYGLIWGARSTTVAASAERSERPSGQRSRWR